MKNRITLISIGIILFVAIALRFYHLFAIPFTYDEFSTLFRLNYKSLSDVIEYGVKQLDNHPAGVQVFLYYYTKLFGTSEVAMKFPFLVLGVWSVWLVFLIGKRWFNSTSGVFAAALMAVLQYPVVQSQIARPYGFGIPFVLLTVWAWDKYMNSEDKLNIKALIIYVLSASIACYTHYFSLLFVAMIGITGLFLVKRKKFWVYLFANLLIFILFIPHLSIFFYQLSKGGIEGWLGKFRFSYLMEYLSYIFHYSIILSSVLALILITSFTIFSEKRKLNYRLISFLWFIIPISIGATYSFFVNNVLHEKVLYFSFPFLLLFMASFIRKSAGLKELVIAIVLLSVGTWSLINERLHYKLFYASRYEQIAQNSIKWTQNLDKNNIKYIKFAPRNIDDYYYQKLKLLPPEILYGDSINNFKQFYNSLVNENSEYLYLGIVEPVDPTYVILAHQLYPETVHQQYTEAGECYLLRKSGKAYQWDCPYYSELTTFNIPGQVQGCDSSILDSLGHSMVISSHSYIASQNKYLDSISFSKNNIIVISTKFTQLDSIGGAMLVATLVDDSNRTVDWRGVSLDSFAKKGDTGVAYLSVFLPDVHLTKGLWLKYFIWNQKREKYAIENIDLVTLPGNPFIYGGTRKIPHNLKPYGLDGKKLSENFANQ